MTRRVFILTLTLLSAAALWAQEAPTPREAPTEDIAFVNVFVDSGARPLAAYQLELKAETGNVKIIGIGGGDHAAFRDAPYFDKAAMSGDRAILAAFSTDRKLPTGRTRVARVMVYVEKGVAPRYTLKLTTAATIGGEKIKGTVSIETGGLEQ